jgi:hypothetical protein
MSAPEPVDAEPVDMAAVREIATMISEFRAEVADKIRTDVELELAQMEAEGFDPARGRGRGPRWIEGG